MFKSLKNIKNNNNYDNYTFFVDALESRFAYVYIYKCYENMILMFVSFLFISMHIHEMDS